MARRKSAAGKNPAGDKKIGETEEPSPPPQSPAAGRRKPAKRKSTTSQPVANRPAEAENSSGDTKERDCVVVGIGASAGGLDAYKRLLRSMPDDSGMAFVLIQHLDPTQESLMVELLSKHTSMPVLQVEQAMPIQPNHVYMIPPNKFIRVENGNLCVEGTITRRGVRLPIDFFFRSLAQARKERSICIVLSGTGSDGAAGLRDVKTEGGITIVQDPEEADYDGMPRAAVATGCVDFILPIDGMADVVLPYAQQPYVKTHPRNSMAESSPEDFSKILTVLRAHTDHDFTHYKPGTLTRRIERRMGMHHMATSADYVKLLRENAAEVHALFKDLLIGVTRFFREPSVWDQLQDHMARRWRNRDSNDPIRVWVPGCSTGEEAYTVAMLLFEQQRHLSAPADVQVFGSDVDHDAIDAARVGIYSENIVKDVSRERLDTFFLRDDGTLRVNKQLRQACIFAVQNLLSDPPFSNLDLICCRNLLIYLQPAIQQRIFDMFHFGLKSDGLLLLGNSESPGEQRQLFETLSSSSRIYRKLGESKQGGRASLLDTGRPFKPTYRPPGGSSNSPATLDLPATPGTVEFSRQALLEEFAPASVVINRQGQIQYFHGPIRDYLDFPMGKPDLDLAAMALKGLEANLRSAVQQARESGETAVMHAPRVCRDGKYVPVRVRAQPLPRQGGESLCLVSFFDDSVSTNAQTTAESADMPAADRAHDKVTTDDRQLALELQGARDDLQSTVEELQSANEELKASNEEVMSMNEELQSTNEELQTSREELQSLNEELITVNNQLHDKIDEVDATNNDLTNLLTSTDMATLFLDGNLQVRRFTPATVRLMKLKETDIGRHVGDLSYRADDPELVDDAREVLLKLAPVQKEVQTGEGNTFIRRITPFRTSVNRIEGVVVTFADVTLLTVAAQRVKWRERQQAAIAELGRAALAGDDLQSLFEQAVGDLATTLDVEYTKVLEHDPVQRQLLLRAGVGWQEGLVGQVSVPAGKDSQGGYTLLSAAPVIVKDLRTETRFAGPQLLTDHGVISGMSTIIGPEESPWGVLGIHAQREIEFTSDDTNFIVAVANVLWDAIRRQQGDTVVRQQLAEIDSTYEATPTGLCLLDTDLRYVRVNSALSNFNGVSIEEHLGRTIRDVVPDLADTLEPIFRRVIETGEPILDVEVRGNRLGNPDVEHCWLASYSPLIIDGEVKGVNASVVDITERIEAEQSLARSRTQLQRLIDSASIGIAVAQRDGTVIQANDALLDIFGISREQYEEQGWDWQDRVLPKDLDFAESMRKLGRSRASETLELRRQDAEKDVVWVLASARPLVEDESEYVAFLVDITAQKQAELALGESEERLRLAARMAKFGTYFADIKSGLLTWSPEFKQILGMSPEDPVDVGVGDVPSFIHPDDRDSVREKVAASLDPAGSGEFSNEHRIIRHDGQTRWLLMQGRTIFRGKGKHRRPVRLAGVALDMTERHQFEEKLKESMRAAEAANEAKSLFLANMSHELRTPMTAILGYADVLLGHVQDPDNKKCVETIKQNGDHLCQILNDILDLAKIESGKLKMRIEACDVVATLANIRSLMAVPATDKKLQLSIDLEGDVPRTIQTDAKLLRQILLNLVGNSVKFTETGSVRIQLSCRKERQQLDIAVIDTGVGIDPVHLEQLFQPFEQIDNSATRAVGGTGLGLSITRKLVEILGGDLTVESALGQGSTFCVTLPTGPLDDTEWVPAGSRALIENGSGMPACQLPTLTGRVLAVDDRREIRYLVEEFLESAGIEVVSRTDGSKAVETWIEQRDGETTFDAVLMDVQMPVMDGLEATRRLREEGYTGPVIALTANAMRSDREKCLEAGCNDFIAKPIDRAELIQKLAHWLHNPPERVPFQRKVGWTVLCVDDHAATCTMQKLLLEDRGHRVTIAHSGAQAIAAVENFAPDAALLDLGLGDLSGGELVKTLRQMPHLADCVFVCLSGRQASDVPWREMGFDHYLEKPTEIEEIERIFMSGKAE